MRRNVTAVPKGDSLCLFCASRLLGLQSNVPRTASRTTRRRLHTRNLLYQSSQAATKTVAESQSTEETAWSHSQAPRGEAPAGFGSGGDDSGWGSGDDSSPWDTHTKVLGKSVPKPANPTPRADRAPQQAQPRWQARWQPQGDSAQTQPSLRLKKANLLRQESSRTSDAPLFRKYSLAGREDRTNTAVPGAAPAVDASTESKDGNAPASTQSQPPGAEVNRGVPLQQELFQWQGRQSGLRGGPGNSNQDKQHSQRRPSEVRLNLDSLRQAAEATAGAGSGSSAGVARQGAPATDATQSMTGRIQDDGKQNSLPFNDTSEQWQHLKFQTGTSEAVATPSPAAPAAPVVSDLDRFKAEREERKRKASQGEAIGWGGGSALRWDSSTSGEAPDRDPSNQTFRGVTRETFRWDSNKPTFRGVTRETSSRNSSQPTFRGITRVMRGTQEPENTTTSAQGADQHTSRPERTSRWHSEQHKPERKSVWDVAEPTNEAQGSNLASRVRRRDKYDVERSSPGSRNSRQKAGGGRRNRDEDDEDIDSHALARMEKREQRKAERAQRRSEAPTPVILPDFISIGNLAAVLRVRPEEFTNKLEELGFEDFTNDHIIGAEDAGLIAQEFNFEPVAAPVEKTREDLVAAPEPSPEDKELMLNRPPVITIMGHVDHGKTTLLDFLRKSSVAAGEHGGITQHIGAFTVEMPSGRTITFLDTPGHSAFLEMRQRGANVTDIVILVVAADDSVKPQTLEAIKHAQGADVPIIVAMSKIDKDEADPERVKRDLAGAGVHVEDFGGDVQAIPVSGKTGQGMEDLEDAAIALADVLDVRADTAGKVEGWILESKLKPQGRVATVLMKRGTLRPGVILVAGTTWTRVRTIRDEAGEIVAEATPGQPVEVDGWDDTPEAGSEALEAPSMQRARDVCELRVDRAEAEKLAAVVAATNEQRVEHRTQRAITKEQQALSKSREVDEDRAAELEVAMELARSNATSKFIQAPIIVRADVAGSAEAVTAAILAMGNTEIRARILREEVGAVTASDVELIEAAEGAIVNFGQPIPAEMRRLLEKKHVKVIDGNVIYRITDAVKEYLEDKLPTLKTQRVLGEADIAQVFEYKMKGRGNVPVAGCRVTNGIVEKGKNVKIFRAGQVIYDGILDSLKNHKRDVDSMQKGTECGMGFEKFTAFEAGDKLQVYEIHEERRKL